MQVRRDDQPAQDARQPVGQAQGGMGKDIGHAFGHLAQHQYLGGSATDTCLVLPVSFSNARS
jgi:hypothetical protein